MLHREMPGMMQWLLSVRCIGSGDVFQTEDGFWLIHKSISAILEEKGIENFPDREGRVLECRNFFDDWFLFSVSEGEETVYGLFKMREQEWDKQKGIPADADTPGVTICFVAFDVDVLKACLEDPSEVNRKKLGMEINRVVAYRKQTHDGVLKRYFVRPQAEAPYLIARRYAVRMASFSTDSILAVPEAYQQTVKKRRNGKRYARIPDFLDENNQEAGRVVCDHENIYIRDRNNLSEYEIRAILATHTGNVSLHSFAAEVRFHALFLTGLAKIRLPVAGAPYASAIRADMSIEDREFQGPVPYYNLSGKMVREQKKYHTDI